MKIMSLLLWKVSHHFLNNLQLPIQKINEEIMREREEEIKNIHKGMHQVNEIYKVSR